MNAPVAPARPAARHTAPLHLLTKGIVAVGAAVSMGCGPLASARVEGIAPAPRAAIAAFDGRRPAVRAEGERGSSGAADLWRGSGRVRILEPRNPAHREMAKALVPFATAIDKSMELRGELAFSVADCEGGSPFYHPASQTIVVCEDAMTAVGRLFAGRRSEAELSTGAQEFILLHELGHALIHIQQLPVVGREEDAADQFAVHYSLGRESGGLVRVLAAAEFFGAMSDRSGFVSDREAAGEHATPRQRMFNLRCWAYGASPSRLEWVVTDGLLPESRAARCPTEVAALDRAWSALLRGTVR